LRCGLVAAGIVLGCVSACVMVYRSPPPNKPWRRRITKLGRWIRTRDKTGAVRWLALLLAVVNVLVAIFVVPALQGVFLLAATTVIYTGPFIGWPMPGQLSRLGPQLVTSSGVWVAIGASTAVAAAWVATPPVAFSAAGVKTSSDEPLNAAYIGREGDGIFIGVCSSSPPTRAADMQQARSRDSHIMFIKNDDLEQLTIGGDQYRFDAGGRPSLGQIAGATLASRSPLQDNAPLSHAPLGHPKAVCPDD
jgi:hypothetical protein